MRLLTQFGACDCHSHVYGPFAKFPLSPKRTFDPPESPIEELEQVWNSFGMDRAVLVQGSAHREDHAALLAAIARSPGTRRGVALLSSDVADAELTKLHQQGIRAVRIHWVQHLRGNDSRTEWERLNQMAELLERVSLLRWHVELHVDSADLDLLDRIQVPLGMPVVIDHMARLDLSLPTASGDLLRLLRVLENDSFWVKISGADRLTMNCQSLGAASGSIRQVIAAAPERCVWGLDWPHVNLPAKRADIQLFDLLETVTNDKKTLERVLIHNPAKLYGFDTTET